jgi:hypothetical protein
MKLEKILKNKIKSFVTFTFLDSGLITEVPSVELTSISSKRGIFHYYLSPIGIQTLYLRIMRLLFYHCATRASRKKEILKRMLKP